MSAPSKLFAQTTEVNALERTIRHEHSDDYGHRLEVSKALRWFLFVERLPALEKFMVYEKAGEPQLFANYQGKPVRVVMASRFGDVGITSYLGKTHGYQKRVLVSELTDFSDEQPEEADEAAELDATDSDDLQTDAKAGASVLKRR